MPGILLVAAIIGLGIALYLGVLNGRFRLGPYFLYHWLAWAGTAYIAIFIPVSRYLRSRNPRRYVTLLRLHVLGNLVSILFITLHLSQQLSRAQLPDLGTGVSLYVIVVLSLATGILLRFGFLSSRRSWWRYVHTGLATGFYIIILIHILHGVGVF